mgnify:CR=1 FL=1
MSVNRFGKMMGKAAIAGFALAVLTAGTAPAKAAVVTWDLWIAYDDALLTTGLGSSATGHGINSAVTSTFGITQATNATGSVTFDDAGCGNAFCGPVEDSNFSINFEFEGTPISFSTNDDFRYNGSSYVNESAFGRGPAMFFTPFAGASAPDFNVQFAHGSSVNNWALSLQLGVIELYDLSNVAGFPQWTGLRGTLCHDGFGEPGESSVCYRGPDTGVVPIPAALPLFASGLVAMGLGAWRRRRSA